MKVGVYRQFLGGLHQGYLQRYEEILNFNEIECIWLEGSCANFWRRVGELDLFIYQWEHYNEPRQIAETIIPIIEFEMGIPCFPNWATTWHYDDKIKQYYLLKYHGFPIIESFIFWDRDKAFEWLDSAGMPVVFKLKGGAGSSNVILVEDTANARRLISKMFGRGIKSGKVPDKSSLQRRNFNPYRRIRRLAGNLLREMRGGTEPLFWQVDRGYVLFQEFLPGNLFDTRVSIIGERAFAFRRFNRENDFRASGSGHIDYDTRQIDFRCIEIAFKISKELGFQSMSYDFLFNEEKEPEISEISYTYVDTAVYNCPGFWDKDFKWQEGHFWPQYLQLMDALGMPDLKQPIIIK